MYGHIIKNARNLKGYSQEALEKQSNIDRSDISKYENDKVNPTVYTLEQLAQGLGMTLKMEFVEPSLVKIFRNSTGYTIRLSEIEPCNRSDIKIPKTLDIWEIINQIVEPKKIPSHILCVWIWERILQSGVFESTPEAISITIASDDDEAIFDCTESIMCLREYINEDDELYGKPMKCGFKNIIESVNIQTSTKQITINLAERLHNEERIRKALDEEKEKIAKAKKYFDEHPDGFEYLVYRIADSEPDNMLDVDFEYDIVIAATKEEALRKYLERNKEDLMSEYYYYLFVEDFSDYLMYGFEQEDFCEIEALEDFISQIIEENITIDRVDEKITSRIVNRLSPGELYRFIGKEHFEEMWFDYEKNRYEVSLSKRQYEILEYLL